MSTGIEDPRGSISHPDTLSGLTIDAGSSHWTCRDESAIRMMKAIDSTVQKCEAQDFSNHQWSPSGILPLRRSVIFHTHNRASKPFWTIRKN